MAMIYEDDYMVVGILYLEAPGSGFQRERDGWQVKWKRRGVRKKMERLGR